MVAPHILCLIPVLPSELRIETLRSIINQTMPVDCVVLATEKAPSNLEFPAKISWVLNGVLESFRLECFDYVLRVDSDTVLPIDFIEKNIALGCGVVGFGPAQLIKVNVFNECMGGRFHRVHDDGYPLVKFQQCGYKVSRNYAAEPFIQRKPGFHHGYNWFVVQGGLHYRYGYDPIGELLVVLYKWRQYHPYGLFFLVGYFKALLLNKKRFDVAQTILYQHLNKYKHPSRFFKLGRLKKSIFRGLKQNYE